LECLKTGTNDYTNGFNIDFLNFNYPSSSFLPSKRSFKVISIPLNFEPSPVSLFFF